MFGVRVRFFREKLKISQNELGQRINKPQTTVSDWENNKYLPNVSDALKLATALGISITELLDESSLKVSGQ